MTLLAAAAPLLLLASQLRLLPQDGGMLLELAGRPVDAAGALQARWQSLVRDCSKVQHWQAGSPTWIQAQQALAAYSPPASWGARPLQLLQDASGDWLLAEVLWDGPGAVGSTAPLDPAIVPLRRSADGLLVHTAGVWSGDTSPWQAPVFIRQWLQQQVPGLPAMLPLCLDPQWPAFAGYKQFSGPGLAPLSIEFRENQLARWCNTAHQGRKAAVARQAVGPILS